MTMNTNAYIGMGLALLGSNMCLLLLLLNTLDWFGIIHADLTPLSRFAEETLSPWRMHFATAAAGWVIVTVFFYPPSPNADPPSKEGDDDEKSTASVAEGRPRRQLYQMAMLLAGVAVTLALPQILESYRHDLGIDHPIIRRSLVDSSLAVDAKHDPASAALSTDDNPQPAAPLQELVFTVEKMTCGGCGSHVRNLAESTLRTQQKRTDPTPSFTIKNVEVDWRAGVMSIYGTHLTDGLLDRDGIANVLKEDGYPTSFLYSQ
eukprot:CAMPEP_0181079352 /NCGR_PEP_ID=MMETSP1071-20121207/1985_1 /TAXON_ID=35127 /ORGANISM="Thalassiosira sp., Strain NH16" /LENGTH=261 /DNA_ID=CAMNT_0023160751 /DNA_START=47 /DNA_END=832 /DNA_ORIENTATION=+